MYTANGRYRAVALLPGNYEITVRKIGFAVDSKKVAIRAGSNAVANFSMAVGEATPAQQPTFGVGARENSITYVTQAELLPPGPGRDLLQRNCLTCHGESFFGLRQQNEARWNTSVNNMIEAGNVKEGALNAQQRAELVGYLTRSFGPDSVRRAVQPDFPLDEEALSKAMYIEYYLPLGPRQEPAQVSGASDRSAGQRVVFRAELSEHDRHGRPPNGDCEGLFASGSRKAIRMV